MTKQLLTIAAVFLFTAACAVGLSAQASRKSVSAGEVNGTFRYNFAGKFKGSASQIKILSLGKGKLQVEFDLVYPYIDGTGELSANMGQASGIAEISGDTAIYNSKEDDGCRITIKFVRPGTIRVDQEGGSACGFGHNVTAGGIYIRESKMKPTFESNL